MTIDVKRTRDIARDWKVARYYDRAEQDDWVEVFWGLATPFRRLFEQIDRRILVDLACGHGRHSARILAEPCLREKVERLFLLDVNAENVRFCKRRFAAETVVTLRRNDGLTFSPIGTGQVTGIFCYDSMVHFELDCIMSYLRDAFRVLVPGGRALFHHSNNESSPGADYREGTQWRNFMSRKLFAHIAIRAGFRVVEQVTVDVGNDADPGHPDENLDCISLVERLERPMWTRPTWTHRASTKLHRLLSRV